MFNEHFLFSGKNYSVFVDSPMLSELHIQIPITSCIGLLQYHCGWCKLE